MPGKKLDALLGIGRLLTPKARGTAAEVTLAFEDPAIVHHNHTLFGYCTKCAAGKHRA